VVSVIACYLTYTEYVASIKEAEIMSIMFSSPGFISMLLMGLILVGTTVGSVVWAIYHIASGKFHVEYEIATVEEKKSK
jgi:hypothetical protein